MHHAFCKVYSMQLHLFIFRFLPRNSIITSFQTIKTILNLHFYWSSCGTHIPWLQLKVHMTFNITVFGDPGKSPEAQYQWNTMNRVQLEHKAKLSSHSQLARLVISPNPKNRTDSSQDTSASQLPSDINLRLPFVWAVWVGIGCSLLFFHVNSLSLNTDVFDRTS